jgi:hypothetical protein
VDACSTCSEEEEEEEEEEEKEEVRISIEIARRGKTIRGLTVTKRREENLLFQLHLTNGGYIRTYRPNTWSLQLSGADVSFQFPGCR